MTQLTIVCDHITERDEFEMYSSAFDYWRALRDIGARLRDDEEHVDLDERYGSASEYHEALTAEFYAILAEHRVELYK